MTHDLPTHDAPRPTLGGLDAAFEFLANERARLAAQRASLPARPLPIPITFESSLEPESPVTSKRRRRRRKASSLVRTGAGRGRGDDADFEDDVDGEDGEVGSGASISVPDTPARRLAATADTTAAGLLAVAAASTSASLSQSNLSITKPSTDKTNDYTKDNQYSKDKKDSRDKGRERAAKNSGSAADYAHRLHHARSTPVLRPLPLPNPSSNLSTTTLALDPQRVRLRALAIKLKVFFPNDANRLSHVLAAPSMGVDADLDGVGEGDRFVDVRGPEPVDGEAVTHVFVD